MQLHWLPFVTRLTTAALCLILLSACMTTPTPGPTLAPPSTPTAEPPVDAFAMNRRHARTVSLGNALEAPNEGDWGVTLQEEYFQLIRQRGFTAVRLPVRWSGHALAEAPYTINPDFFKRVDWAVEQALKNDLAIVVNLHHYEEMALDATGQHERFLALWRQIAEHYRHQPNAVLFELMNEPNGALTASSWNRLIAKP